MNEVTEEAGLAMDRLDQVGIALEGGFRARLQNLGNVGNEWDTLVQGLAAGGHSLGTFLAVILGAVLVSAAAFYGARRVLQGLVARSGRFSSFIDIATVVLTVLVVTLVFRLIVPDGTLRQVARFWAIATLIGLLVQRLVTRLAARQAQRRRSRIAARLLRENSVARLRLEPVRTGSAGNSESVECRVGPEGFGRHLPGRPPGLWASRLRLLVPSQGGCCGCRRSGTADGLARAVRGDLADSRHPRPDRHLRCASGRRHHGTSAAGASDARLAAAGSRLTAYR